MSARSLVEEDNERLSQLMREAAEAGFIRVDQMLANDVQRAKEVSLARQL